MPSIFSFFHSNLLNFKKHSEGTQDMQQVETLLLADFQVKFPAYSEN
jgi:hypothetical protein